MQENKYRTSGVIDESTYREIGKFSLSRRYIWFTRIVAVIMALFMVLMLIARRYLYAALFLAFTVLFALRPRRLIKAYLNTAIKRMNETYPPGSMQMETWFTEQGVALHNLTDGAQLVLAYGAFQRVAETERYFYLVTKSGQFTLVFKDLLTPEQKRDFLPFLQGRCPDIKVVR